MSLGLIIFLILLGLLLFIIEFMLIPGITIAGVGGAICIIIGIILSFTTFGTGTGMAVLGGTTLLLIVSTVLMLRSRHLEEVHA